MAETSWQMWFTLSVLLLEVAAFATNKIRLDVTVLLGCYALVIAKVVTSKEALAGFGDSTTMMITSTFVLGMGIQNSGLADEIAMVLKKGTMGKQWLFMLELMLIAAGLSAFMSNTGTVAIMLPIVLSTIKECGWQKRPFLMALAFASSLGGCLTIIGTPPNMVVNDYLISTTGSGLSFFGFAPIGIVCLAIGVVYMLFVGKWILLRTAPTDTKNDDDDTDSPRLSTLSTSAVGHIEGMGESNTKLVGDKDVSGVTDRSVSGNDSESAFLLVASIASSGNMANKRYCDLGLHSKYAVTVLATGNAAGTVQPINFRAKLGAMDRLYICGGGGEMAKFEAACEDDVAVVAKVPVPADAVLFKPTHGSALPSDLGLQKISLDVEQGNDAPADVFAVSAKNAKRAREFGEVYGAGIANGLKQLTISSYFAVMCMVLVVVLMFFEGVIPNVTTMMLGATLMCMLGCMSAADAYRSIHWESVVLIGGMIPMSTALQKTGAIDIVVEALGTLGTTTSPLVVLTVLFLLAAGLTQVISNTATAILIAPVAAQCAAQLGVSPTPFLVGLAIAASCAFMTPVGSPVNVLVMAPGAYSFIDFVYAGTVLQLLLFAVTVALVPVIYPF